MNVGFSVFIGNEKQRDVAFLSAPHVVSFTKQTYSFKIDFFPRHLHYIKIRIPCPIAWFSFQELWNYFFRTLVHDALHDLCMHVFCVYDRNCSERSSRRTCCIWWFRIAVLIVSITCFPSICSFSSDCFSTVYTLSYVLMRPFCLKDTWKYFANTIPSWEKRWT